MAEPYFCCSVNVVDSGDPLEIFTDREGGVILKKYSPIGELKENAQELATSLYQTFALPAAICDKDTFVASAGMGKRDIAGKTVSADIERAMAKRSRIVEPEPGEARHCLLTDEDASCMCAARVIIPIVSQGDAIGAVGIFSQRPDVSVDAAAVKACETVACFLGKQMDA